MAIPKIPELLEFSQLTAPSISDRCSVIAMPSLIMLNAVGALRKIFQQQMIQQAEGNIKSLLYAQNWALDLQESWYFFSGSI